MFKYSSRCLTVWEYSKSKNLSRSKNVGSNNRKPQLEFQCICARPIYWIVNGIQCNCTAQIIVMQRIAEPGPRLRLIQSILLTSNQSALSFKTVHQIQVQGLSNSVWILHSRRIKCSLCSQISCLSMNKWGSCNHWFPMICNGVFLQASLSAPVDSYGSLHFSQSTYCW